MKTNRFGRHLGQSVGLGMLLVVGCFGLVTLMVVESSLMP